MQPRGHWLRRCGLPAWHGMQLACTRPLPGAPLLGGRRSPAAAAADPTEAALPPPVVLLCFFPKQGTHVKYIAESEPTMAELIEKSRQERAVALAGGEAGPAAAAAGGLAAAGAAGGQGSQQQGEQGVLQWLHGSAGPRSKL